MPYPDNLRGSYQSTQEFTCKSCGYWWEVEGEVDLGYWDPYDEDDLECPTCGKHAEG